MTGVPDGLIGRHEEAARPALAAVNDYGKRLGMARIGKGAREGVCYFEFQIHW